MFIHNWNFLAGDIVAAVVPFMGESITDGTLATFLKSMLYSQLRCELYAFNAQYLCCLVICEHTYT